MRLERADIPGVFRVEAGSSAVPAAFPLGLGEQGVHEVCEGAYGDYGALAGFVLAARAVRPGALVWIGQAGLTREHGRLFQAGAGQVTRHTAPVMSVTVRKPAEALWACEEAVASGAAGLVVVELSGLDFTASRRLTLAAGRHGVPLVLMLPYGREGASAASARWRVRLRPSAPNRYDPRAPGKPRWQAVLERSRQAPHLAGQSFDLELDDETLSLRVVSGLAAHSPAPRPVWAGHRIGPPARRSA